MSRKTPKPKPLRDLPKHLRERIARMRGRWDRQDAIADLREIAAAKDGKKGA